MSENTRKIIIWIGITILFMIFFTIGALMTQPKRIKKHKHYKIKTNSGIILVISGTYGFFVLQFLEAGLYRALLTIVLGYIVGIVSEFFQFRNLSPSEERKWIKNAKNANKSIYNTQGLSKEFTKPASSAKESIEKADNKITANKQKTSNNKKARNKVIFDSDGQIESIKIPQNNWSVQINGQSTYYTQTANSLYEATEILKKIDSIPKLTYYLVDTPDGTLCRDIQGYFTEASLKTMNLVVESRCEKSEPVNFSSLMGFGDMQANQTNVAHLKITGQYSKLILLMKCGQCGYESPVETEPGTLIRECYCCGIVNKGHRTTITMYSGSIKIEI